MTNTYSGSDNHLVTRDIEQYGWEEIIYLC